MEQVLWVDEGIIGAVPDGHIDDTVRFVNEDTVITVIEEDNNDENYELLQHNLKQLKAMRLLNGKQLNIIELPMPEKLIYDDQRLPCSYANFYIANKSVIVPVFQSDRDEKALQIIQDCFPDRNVVGIDSLDIIWGLGSRVDVSNDAKAVLGGITFVADGVVREPDDDENGDDEPDGDETEPDDDENGDDETGGGE